MNFLTYIVPMLKTSRVCRAWPEYAYVDQRIHGICSVGWVRSEYLDFSEIICYSESRFGYKGMYVNVSNEQYKFGNGLSTLNKQCKLSMCEVLHCKSG